MKGCKVGYKGIFRKQEICWVIGDFEAMRLLLNVCVNCVKNNPV